MAGRAAAGDLLEEGGSRAGYANVSNQKIATGYGRWLTWLDRHGLLELTTTPGARITPARVRDYVVDLFEEITREPLNAPTSFGSSRSARAPPISFVFVWSYHQFR